jgi:hypothetical protein
MEHFGTCGAQAGRISARPLQVWTAHYEAFVKLLISFELKNDCILG